MSRMQRWITYAVNHRTCFGFGIVLTVIHLILVAERVYRYRHNNGWVVTARACGQMLHFECVLVFALTLRRSITWLRAKGLDWLLPLDRHIYFHKLIGWLICIFSVVHTVAHVINYGLMSIANGVELNDYLFDVTAGWIPGLVTPTGFALLFILLVMGIFSHRMVRKSGRFELFYWTHLLYVPFIPLMIMHGGNVWKWLLLPTILLAFEVVHRIRIVFFSELGRARVTALRLLPNQVIRLTIDRPVNFPFRPGDYVFVNLPQVARFEWHPFTISSAPEEEDYMTLHIRVAGGWTGRLYSICQEHSARLDRQQSMHKIAQKHPSSKLSPLPLQLGETSGQDNPAYQHDPKPVLADNTGVTVIGNRLTTVADLGRIAELARPDMPIMMDGPYSGSATRAWNCRHALFIAGGIGVTPFASILQSLVNRYQSSMMACPHCLKPCCTSVPESLGKLRHVDFMWINRDLMSFQWFLELLLDMDREQSVSGSVMSRFLDIQLYQTGAKINPDTHPPCGVCYESPSSPQVPKTTETDPLDATSIIVPATATPQVTSKCAYCTIRQMQHLLRYGRPVWDEVFREIAVRSGGRVTVYYCGPAPLSRVVMNYCKKFGFTFTKEIS